MGTETPIPVYMEGGEVARRLGVSHKTLNLWVRQGRISLAARTVLGTRLYDPFMVERYAESLAKKREAADADEMRGHM